MADLIMALASLAERLPDLGVVHIPVGPALLVVALAAQAVFERFHGS